MKSAVFSLVLGLKRLKLVIYYFTIVWVRFVNRNSEWINRCLSFYFDFSSFSCFLKPTSSESLLFSGLEYVLLAWDREGWDDVFESKDFRSNGLLSEGFEFSNFWKALLRSLNKEFLGAESWDALFSCWEKGELDRFYPNKLGKLFVMVSCLMD